MGLKLARTVGSRLGFLIRGCTTACFRFSGTFPESRLLFITASTDGPTVGKTSLKSRGATGSFGEPVGFNLETISCTKDRATGSNWLKIAEHGAGTEA